MSGAIGGAEASPSLLSPSDQFDPSHYIAFLSGVVGGGHELHSLLGKDCFHMDSAASAALVSWHSALCVDGGMLPACETHLGRMLLPGLPCRELLASIGLWRLRAAPRSVLCGSIGEQRNQPDLTTARAIPPVDCVMACVAGQQYIFVYSSWLLAACCEGLPC